MSKRSIILGRTAFTIFALFSLVISVTALGMWLRRVNLSDQYLWVSSRGPADGRPATMRGWELRFEAGVVRFERTVQEIDQPEVDFWNSERNNRFKHDADAPGFRRPLTWPASGMTSRVYVDGHGIGLATMSRSIPLSRFRSFVVALPLWLIIALFAIPPLIWEIRYRRWILRRFRKGAGLCANCGYDMRATPVRCPECGAIRRNVTNSIEIVG